MTVRNLRRTSLMCPTQYEVELEDGREALLHYRWGKLEITVEGVALYSWDSGDWLGGHMDHWEALSHLQKAGFQLPGYLPKK